MPGSKGPEKESSSVEGEEETRAEELPGELGLEEDFELQTNLLPETAFENNTGEYEIEDIASNDNYTVVVKKVGEVPEIFIYNFNNQLEEKEIPIANFEVGKYLENVHQNDCVSIDYGDRGDLKNHLKGFCSKEEVSKVEQFFVNLAPKLKAKDGQGRSKYMYKSDLLTSLDGLQKKKPILDQQLRVKTDEDGNYFLVRYGDRIVTYKVREEDSNLLPSQWQETVFPTRDDVERGSSGLPFVNENFVYFDKSKIIPETELVVSLTDKGMLTIVDREKGTKHFSAGARSFDLDPLDQKTIFYINATKNTIQKVNIDDLEKGKYPVKGQEVKGVRGELQEIKLDPNGNFFIIQYQTPEGEGKLTISERDTLEKVVEYENVKGNIEIDQTGNIYFTDKDNKLRVVTTNFGGIPKGGLEAVREAKEERLKALLGKVEGLDIQGIRTSKVKKGKRSKRLDEEVIVGELEGKLGQLFEKDIKKAKDLASLDEIAAKLGVLREDPDFAVYPQAFLAVERTLAEKESKIRTADLRRNLEDFEALLASASSLEKALELEEYYNSLVVERSGVTITGLEIRREIDQTIAALGEKKEKILANFQDELIGKIGGYLGKIEKMISETNSLGELNALESAPEWMDLEELLASVGDSEIVYEWREKLHKAREVQEKSLRKRKEELEEKERFKIAQLLEEVGEILSRIGSTIDEETSTPEELEKRLKRNPLITKYRARILTLPDNLRVESERKLEELINTKRRDLEHFEVLSISREGDEANFGGETFPIFRDIEAVWQPKTIPLAKGSEYGSLVFADNFGRTYRPEIGSVPVDLNDPATQETIELYQGKAKEYFESLKRRVADFREDWIMSDYYLEKLGKIAKLLRIQMDQQRGFLILEGEAGTGKNVLFEMFAHFTNREIFNLSCNFQTTKEDVTYAFRFDPKEGTYKVSSELIEGLKTDGAIIVLDEINTLPPGVAKMLNSLLDYRRTLYLPEGREEIKARPSVLIVGTMNPQYYLGTKPLSQEVKSRARVQFIEYPPERRIIDGRDKFTPDEALILSKYIDSLKGLKQEELTTLWDYVVNQEKDNGGDRLTNKERRKAINKIRKIIQIANKIREAHEAFRRGSSDEIVEFVFSLRETIDIVSEMNNFKDVKEAIKDVILPKISDPRERETVKTIIDNT